MYLSGMTKNGKKRKEKKRKKKRLEHEFTAVDQFLSFSPITLIIYPKITV